MNRSKEHKIGMAPIGWETRLMRKTLAVAATVGASTLCLTAANAQSMDYGAFEELFGEAITTSVTGSPQRQSDVPATMEIITADDIRRSGARDIPSVLRDVAGVDVLRWGSDHSDVAIRGYNQAFSPRLLVLIDGRQVYADFYGFTPWATLPLELGAIRQIEVIKGPSSALFGFNAVGGVINIVTYDPLYDQPQTASVAAGSQEQIEASGVTTFRLGDEAGVLISAGSRRNDDFWQPAPGLDRNGRNALAAELSWRINDRVHAGVEATYSDADQLEVGPSYTPSFSRYETSSIKSEVAVDTRYGLFEATLYHNEIDVAVEVEAFISSVPNLDIDNRVSVVQLKDIFKIGTDHAVRLSMEYRENSMGTTPIPGGDVSYDVASFGGMWEWKVAPAITFSNAVRVDRLSMERGGSTPDGYGLSNAAWDRTLTENSFNTGVVWQKGDLESFRFMVGRGAQLPSLFNLGGGVFAAPPVGFFGGHPAVSPSVATNFEIGWDRTLATLGAQLRASLYHGRTRDIVALVGGNDFAAGLVNTATNVGDSEADGFEVSIRSARGESWRWAASYARETISDRIDPGFSLATTFVDFENTLPRHVVNASLGWANGPWEVDGYVHYQSRFNGIGAGAVEGTGVLVPISGFVSVDARIGYRLGERTTLALTGENINRASQRQTTSAEIERRILASLVIEF